MDGRDLRYTVCLFSMSNTPVSRGSVEFMHISNAPCPFPFLSYPSPHSQESPPCSRIGRTCLALLGSPHSDVMQAISCGLICLSHLHSSYSLLFARSSSYLSPVSLLVVCTFQLAHPSLSFRTSLHRQPSLLLSQPINLDSAKHPISVS